MPARHRGRWAALHTISDVVHILAAAAWLGGLPALMMTLPTSSAIAATRRFSILGIICVGALLASGVVNSWLLLNGPGDLTTTAYGRILSIKIGLFVVMVAVATVNRYWLTPHLPAATAVRALRRNSLIETGIGFAVLMLVGALGTMIPGGHVHTNAAQPQSEAAFVHIHTDVVMADVTIDPGHLGKNTATIRLSREDYSDYPARDVKLAIGPRDGPTPSLERRAVRSPEGTWQIENIEIPNAGVWTLRLTIGPMTGAPVVLDAPIVVTQ